MDSAIPQSMRLQKNLTQGSTETEIGQAGERTLTLTLQSVYTERRASVQSHGKWVVQEVVTYMLYSSQNRMDNVLSRFSYIKYALEKKYT